MARKSKKLSNNLLENIIISALFISIIFSVCLYLYQMNDFASSGIRISELERRAFGLEREMGDLKIESARLQSIGILEKESAKMGMVQVSSPDFLSLKEEIVLR